MAKRDIRNIISFWELSDEWQKEAVSNLNENAWDAKYLEPSDDAEPEIHILWDLTECMTCEGITEDFEYNGLITISNNSAMLLWIDHDLETAEVKFI